MSRSVIDPINRIEGHLRIEMEVENGYVSEAWVSGGLFRGLELINENRTPTDAALVAQRICGVCPVSHLHTSCFAAEEAYGIQIPNNARIIRNLVEGAQFLHSHILWFYNLAALDYVNPLNGLNADIADTYALAEAAGTTDTDFEALAARLTKFAENGQLSIFSGNWFDSGDGTEYKLPAELDLIATAHYIEALEMQATADEIAALLGGKMPHVMSSIPGGTTFYPTEEKLDDILYRIEKIRNWIENTMIPDTLAIAPFYPDGFFYGKGPGRLGAWGVFDRESRQSEDRYMPSGIFDLATGSVSSVDESKILEHIEHSYYEGYTGGLNPHEGITQPAWPEDGYNVNNKYTWSKAPRYDGKTLEVGALARIVVAYMRNVTFIKDGIDGVLETLNQSMQLEFGDLISTMGRLAGRNIEVLYVATCMLDWVNELIECLKGGDAEFFLEPAQTTGEGLGMWEAPRGALYHYEKIENDKIKKYQAIVPSTWNISPRDEKGNIGPMEEALIGLPVPDLEKPIHALRTVHSFDPCVACAIHVSEPMTGKHFETVTNPWGVK